MTRPTSEYAELDVLIGAVRDEVATPEQVRRLEELILADPAAEARFVQAMALHGGLIACLASGSVTPSQEVERVPPSPARKRWGRNARTLWVSAAAAIAFVAFGLAWRNWPQGDDSSRRPQGANEVATLTRSVEAVWSGMQSCRMGTQLIPGTFELKSGLVQIEFFTGATVVLEGPAEFRLVSSSEVFCNRGKIRTLVPFQASGFLVRTPHLDIVDRGTEFALEVSADATAEIHVYQGAVEVYEPGAGAGAATGPIPSQELRAGQGERRRKGRQPVAIPVDSKGFVSIQEMDERYEADMARRYAKWRESVATTANDPSLLVYFPFDGEQSWGRTLTDFRPGGAKRNGAIVGAAWVDGRWPGHKRGLEFKEKGDRVRFHVPGRHKSATLAAWVMVDRLERPYNALMLTDNWNSGEMHWQILADGSVVLGLRGDRENGWTDAKSNYASPRIFSPSDFGRWNHLAVVYDGEFQQTVTHYLNGRPVSADAIRFEVLLRIENAELGNWVRDYFHDSPSGRGFCGRMDEFMIFARPLSGFEIETIYQNGKIE